MKKELLNIIIIIVVIVAGIVAVKYFVSNKEAVSSAIDQNKTEFVIQKNNMNIISIKTNLGLIKFTTYDADAPKTVQNFITLAEKGFYNNIIFHRVIKGFMIQGGDPNCGNSSLGACGTGGPGYKFEDELNPDTDSYKAGYKKGVVAMANSGSNTNGSQFFIMLENYPLQNNYTIFGKVIEGQNVVDAIGNQVTDGNDRPITPVTIESVTVEKNS
ncbi:MAG: peptidyl-prolyl cis-trans isomerase-like 1 [Parcubacteria group bacterium Athens0714_26]|nr:MAG: peptidyl-prolyl cis-trans isomerase-like 1 [Parcubacteria group bacterium Athens1014_26]TSD03776.1 MAG: peptidyl-prolyl cis-trans isomerase-like 1 [Parcubacteria group bacterium Athens0714_26]